jgi:putative peptidoglycan lipid II flippase
MISNLFLSLERWSAWRDRSVNRQIFAALLTVGSLTVLVKLAAMAKELVAARQFGTSDAMDAFLMAYLLPSFAVNVIAGPFSAALIPTYVQVKEREGVAAAQLLFSHVFGYGLIMLLLVTGLIAVAMPVLLPFLASGFGPDKMALTLRLFYCLLPVVLFSGLSTIASAVLNAGERFAFASLTPIATPILIVLALLTMANAWGIYAFAAGVVAGVTVQTALMGFALTRQGLWVLPQWNGLDDNTRQVFKEYVPLIAGTVFWGSTEIVNQSMAAMLGSGSISALDYGNKLVGFILGTGSLAMSTAILPYLSRMVAVADWTALQRTLVVYVRLILSITIPLVAGLIYFSEPIVRLLFERGAFTPQDTSLVGNLQALLLLQVPFYVFGMLFVRLISALKGNHLLLWNSIAILPITILLNYWLIMWFDISGIALSISCVYILSCFYLLIASGRLLKATKARTMVHESLPRVLPT